MNAFIDAHRDRFGVEPICRVLQHAPSTYYAARSRPPSARAIRDEQLKADIKPREQPGLIQRWAEQRLSRPLTALLHPPTGNRYGRYR
jgi:hypothetical protein